MTHSFVQRVAVYQTIQYLWLPGRYGGQASHCYSQLMFLSKSIGNQNFGTDIVSRLQTMITTAHIHLMW